ncbi:ATP-binding cassette domain-containing protein [Tengunoibacter tsumagoiensis]|uniref:ABC transporter ATP-binding protein n=1 Tax=Tengunoibacter tsumagoiensis TaxID=2014871 RepID=A0A402A4E9_9CHLR|nr:ATP-binding cassette domain-containing protein [Tengunoibacter tsumagoiensis]GCE13875.1 ABC transporter ATP-binding protein [Tengunoibacter tsumagoiensis]
MLQIEHVSKQYTRKRLALNNLSLHLDAGIWGLIGPNGAGKTTLLRILATQLIPSQGRILWREKDIFNHPYALRQELGYLPQDFGGYSHLTAYEFVQIIGELKGLHGQKLKKQIEELLEIVHLSADAHQRLKSFSGGMLRRVGIAQMLLGDPHLLLLDEPTVGLDPKERVLFRELISSLAEERIVLISSHIISDIEAMATNVIVLNKGQLCWNDTTLALQAHASNSIWAISIDTQGFEKLRTQYQISTVVRRQQQVEARLVASHQPHHLAVPVEPSLEEAYLYLLHEEG